MQQRRHIPLIVLTILALAVASLFGLSYVYTPSVKQHTESIELDSSVLNKTKPAANQPIEYP